MRSHGYEFKKDGFGYAGARIKPDTIGELQRRVYERFPTVTVINVADILDRVQEESMRNPERPNPDRGGWGGKLAMWMVIGAALGVGIGAWMDNTGAGVAIGIAAAVVIGAIIDRMRSRR